MATNENMVPKIPHINAQECRSDTEIEPDNDERYQKVYNITINKIDTQKRILDHYNEDTDIEKDDNNAIDTEKVKMKDN